MFHCPDCHGQFISEYKDGLCQRCWNDDPPESALVSLRTENARLKGLLEHLQKDAKLCVKVVAMCKKLMPLDDDILQAYSRILKGGGDE